MYNALKCNKFNKSPELPLRFTASLAYYANRKHDHKCIS